MVIRELKPSQRVEGRWLAVLEDGSILRLGEGEVVRFALYAGKELTDQEAEQLTASAEKNSCRQGAVGGGGRGPYPGGTPERTAPESPQPADLQTHVPPGAGAEAPKLGGGGGGGSRHR